MLKDALIGKVVKNKITSESMSTVISKKTIIDYGLSITNMSLTMRLVNGASIYFSRKDIDLMLNGGVTANGFCLSI